MKRTILVLVIAVFSIGTASGQAPAKQPKTFLSCLKEGQIISLTDIGGKYEIYVLDGGPNLAGHKVIEIGTDYLAVEDTDGLTETRIPVSSIKAIFKMKGPK